MAFYSSLSRLASVGVSVCTIMNEISYQTVETQFKSDKLCCTISCFYYLYCEHENGSPIRGMTRCNVTYKGKACLVAFTLL